MRLKVAKNIESESGRSLYEVMQRLHAAMESTHRISADMFTSANAIISPTVCNYAFNISSLGCSNIKPRIVVFSPSTNCMPEVAEVSTTQTYDLMQETNRLGSTRLLIVEAERHRFQNQ